MVSFNKLTRTLAGIAAAALIVPLAACGGSGNGGTATAEGIPAKGTDDGTEITLWTRSPLERQAKNVVELTTRATRTRSSSRSSRTTIWKARSAALRRPTPCLTSSPATCPYSVLGF